MGSIESGEQQVIWVAKSTVTALRLQAHISTLHGSQLGGTEGDLGDDDGLQ